MPCGVWPQILALIATARRSCASTSAPTWMVQASSAPADLDTVWTLIAPTTAWVHTWTRTKTERQSFSFTPCYTWTNTSSNLLEMSYTLWMNSFSCRSLTDINECEVYGTCPQGCKNTKGSYDCECAPGYRKVGDGKMCEAEGERTVFFMKLLLKDAPLSVMATSFLRPHTNFDLTSQFLKL